MKATLLPLLLAATLWAGAPEDAAFLQSFDPATERLLVAWLNELPALEGQCSLHRRAFVPGCMTLMAGNTMIPNEPMLRYLRMAVFPNSRLWGYSRDGSVEEPPKTHHEIQVMYCPVCREAELSWWRYQWQQAHLRGER